VKAVMIGLAFASVVTWTVWLAKTIELWSVKRATRRALQAIAEARSLPEAIERVGPGSNAVFDLLEAAQAELRLSSDAMDREGVKERTVSRLERIEAAYGRRVTRGTNILATIGATAPFVGLFGTVVGIMQAFRNMAVSGHGGFAVVAAGISEALVTTAGGIAVAIEAVVIYNFLNVHVGKLALQLKLLTEEYLEIVREALAPEAAPPAPRATGEG
jgi:biopolymer transport protein ExbB